ncbi:SH3 domain-containing protein [Myxococcaceae bacterium GXIMD 01537]
MALLALGLAGSAGAVESGGTLYVKAKNTRLMESAAASANVVQVLQPGQAVVWRGADPKDKRWHLVEVGKKKGVVFQSNLSTRPPDMELLAGKSGVSQKDAAAFANSAAAVKLLSEGSTSYGKKKGTDFNKAVTQLQDLENIAKAVNEAEYTEHAKKAGLSLVAGGADAGGKPVVKEGTK